MSDEQDIIRVIEDEAPAEGAGGPAWKVAIIDDDAAVHEGTRFALYDYSLNGQALEILSAETTFPMCLSHGEPIVAKMTQPENARAMETWLAPFAALFTQPSWLNAVANEKAG